MERRTENGHQVICDKGILIKNIYYMLSYAFQALRRENFAQIEAEAFDGVHNLFAEILLRGIPFQLKQGLYREYVEVEDSLMTVRGKIDINGTIANRMRMNRRMHCTYDELSVNNVFNQILKATVLALVRCGEVDADKRMALKRLLPYFCDVEDIDVRAIRWSSLCFSRNNATYQLLINICFFLLNGMLMTTADGRFKMMEFSDDHMCRLYEKFILEFYRRHFPELHAHDAQIPWNVDVENSTMGIIPKLQSDIMLNFPSGRTLIIDAKYYGRVWQEHYNKKTVHSHNLYQILAYVTNKDVGHTGNVDGMLLYAKTQEAVVPDGQMTCKDGNRIFFKTLDLNQDFEGIKKQLEGLVVG